MIESSSPFGGYDVGRELGPEGRAAEWIRAAAPQITSTRETSVSPEDSASSSGCY
jgi:hypothetical protein